MKKIFSGFVLASLALGFTSAHAQYANVIISGEVRPGVYGQVQIGNAPPPVVYSQPVVVVHEPRYAHYEPVYMHVPPGHAKHWSKHCHKYGACNRPVYFVKSAEYDPGYRHDNGKGHGKRWD